MKIYLSGILICFTCFFCSCEKEPGEGGLASIKGQLYVLEYNGNCTDLRHAYYAVDELVYIVAGNEPSYFERVRTGPDGTYWFPYLRKGKYTVYALSEDCRLNAETDEVEMILENNPEAKEVEVEITGRKEQVVLEDIVVFR